MEHLAPDDPATFDIPLDNATHHIADWRIVRGLMQAAETISARPRIVVSPDIERLAIRGVKVDANEVALAVATGYDLFPELHTPVTSDHETTVLPGERDGFAPLPEVDFFNNLSFCHRTEILEEGDATSSFVIDQEGAPSSRLLLDRPMTSSVFGSSALDAALSPEHVHLASLGRKKRLKPNPAAEGFDLKLAPVSSDPPKRKRRPRRCQNRIVVNGETIICGLIDCPGRGGQKFCKNFCGEAKQAPPPRQQIRQQRPPAPTDEGRSYSLTTTASQSQSISNEAKRSTLATLICPIRDSEMGAVAIEALQHLI